MYNFSSWLNVKFTLLGICLFCNGWAGPRWAHHISKPVGKSLGVQRLTQTISWLDCPMPLPSSFCNLISNLWTDFCADHWLILCDNELLEFQRLYKPKRLSQNACTPSQPPLWGKGPNCLHPLLIGQKVLVCLLSFLKLDATLSGIYTIFLLYWAWEGTFPVSGT